MTLYVGGRVPDLPGLRGSAHLHNTITDESRTRVKFRGVRRTPAVVTQESRLFSPLNQFAQVLSCRDGGCRQAFIRSGGAPAAEGYLCRAAHGPQRRKRQPSKVTVTTPLAGLAWARLPTMGIGDRSARAFVRRLMKCRTVAGHRALWNNIGAVVSVAPGKPLLKWKSANVPAAGKLSVGRKLSMASDHPSIR